MPKTIHAAVSNLSRDSTSDFIYGLPTLAQRFEQQMRIIEGSVLQVWCWPRIIIIFADTIFVDGLDGDRTAVAGEVTENQGKYYFRDLLKSYMKRGALQPNDVGK